MCCHSNNKARDHARHEATFSVSKPEDRESMLHFTLNQSDSELQIEEDIFRGFGAKECKREGEHCLKSLHNHNYFFPPQVNIKFDFSFSFWERKKAIYQRRNTSQLFNTTVCVYK